MPDCPGILHLAAMADGSLARIRTIGGALTAGQARAVAEAATRLGSGVIEVTNRANLQIRGLMADAGPALVETLAAAGFSFAGPADRRRNILLDPLSGLDPAESRDLRPVSMALDDGLRAVPWIGGLSPKFSFVLDGGGSARVGATPSDVTALGLPHAILLAAGRSAVLCASTAAAVSVMLAVAQAAAGRGAEARVRDLTETEVLAAFSGIVGLRPVPAPSRPALAPPPLGAVRTRVAGLVAVCIPIPVGRLDPAMLNFLADAAEQEGDGRLVLAPWSAIVLPGVREARAVALLSRSEARGFLPVAVAERISVTACAGAPACERARAPAKTLGAAILARAAAEPALMPARASRLHLSACPKGCAGSAPADLLLLGASDRTGWSLHRNAAPRAAGPAFGRLESPDAAEILGRLRQAVEA